MSLALHQSVIAFTLAFKLCSMSLISKLVYCTEVSSANKSQIAFLTESERGHLSIKKIAKVRE